MNPIAIVFGVLVSFALGVAIGLQLGKWLMTLFVKHAHCDDFHDVIIRVLAQHCMAKRHCHVGLVDLVKAGMIQEFDCDEGPTK